MSYDIRIIPNSGLILFTSSIATATSLVTEASGSLGFVRSNTSSSDNILFIDGINGRLFSVSDSLSDTLFSVNTISGIPVLEVNADNTVKIGNYFSSSFVASGSGDAYIANNSLFVSSSGEMFLSGSSPSLTFHETDTNGNWSVFVNSDTFTVRNSDDSYNPFFINDFNNVFVPYRLSIGTVNSPKVPLDVNGDVLVTGSLTVTTNIIGLGNAYIGNNVLFVSSSGFTNLNGILAITSSVADYKLIIRDNASGGAGLLINGGGSGGPLARFERTGTGTGVIEFNSNTSQPQIRVIGSNTFSFGESGSSFVIADDNSLHEANTNNTQRFVINSSGNVGLGTMNPSQARLVVNGDIAIPRANSLTFLESISGTFRASINSSNTDITGVGFNSLRFFNDADSTTPKMVIGGSVNSGNVGIGTTNPTFKLDVSGTFRATTSITSSLLNIDNLQIDGNTISSTNTNGDIILDTNGTGLVDVYSNLRLRATTGGQSLTTLIPSENGGNSRLKIKGENFNHNIQFETGWNTFIYSQIVASYSGSHTYQDYYLSNGAGATVGTTRISTGTSYFTGSVGINTQTPTTTLDVNGIIRAVTSVTSSLLNIDNIQIDGNRISATTGNIELDTHFRVTSSDVFEWGASYGQGLLSWDTNKVMMGARTTNNLEIWGGGSSRIFVSSSGLVGIGTSSPNKKLHVYDGASGVTAYDLKGVNIESDGITGINILSTNAQSGRIYFGAPISNTAGSIEYFHSATLANGYMKLRAGGGDRIYISGSGDVGIGTSTPSEKLDVAGDVYIGGSGGTIGGTNLANGWLRIGTTLALDPNEIVFGGDANIGTSTAQPLNIKTSDASRIYITSDGNIGINTTTPNSRLNVNNGELNITSSASTPTILLYDTSAGNDPYIRFVPSTTTNAFSIGIDDSDSDKFKISYGSNAVLGTGDRFVIDVSGNVGIGTIDPIYKLHIEDTTTTNVLISTPDNSGISSLYINHDSGLQGGLILQSDKTNSIAKIITNNSSYFPLAFFVRGGDGTLERMRINSLGNVGIGTASPNANSKLQISSDNITSGVRVVVSNSDESSFNYLWSGFNTNEPAIVWKSGKHMRFGTETSISSGFSEKVRILDNGNVGIGTSVPSALLHMSSSGTTTFLLQSGDRTFYITQGSGALNSILNSNNFLEFQTDGVKRMTVEDTRVRSEVYVDIKGSIYDTQSTGSIGLTEVVVATVNASSFPTVFFDYSVKNGTNMRAGTLIAVYNGTSMEWTETSTVDLGNTSGVTLSADVNGGNIRLKAIATTTGWTVKAMIRGF